MVAHEASRGTYGVPRILDDLRDLGTRTSKRRCGRLMRAVGLRGRKKHARQPRTTDSRHAQPVAPNLIAERPAPTGPNQCWLTDITYLKTAEGWLYLAGVKDMATREIVGWAMEDHMRAELCCEALKMALGRRGPVSGLIHHSDRGSQYAGGKYRKLINKGGLTQSMSRKGECLDNAPMESFFASLKKELVHRQRFRTRAQAKAAIFEYIEVFYNRQRRHSSIGYQTPVQAFEDMTWKMAA